MNLAPRELSGQGGMQAVLQKEKISHLAVEELDYSVFLKGEAERSRTPGFTFSARRSPARTIKSSPRSPTASGRSSAGCPRYIWPKIRGWWRT